MVIKKLVSWSKQKAFSFSKSGSSLTVNKKLSIPYAFEDEVVKAVVLQALHIADANHFFSSALGDSKLFAEMIPYSKIAQSYSQGESKVKYTLQYGIFPYVKEQLLVDLDDSTPFTFKFDETTNRQVKKQFDGYTVLIKNPQQSYQCLLWLSICRSLQKRPNFGPLQTVCYRSRTRCELLLHIGMDGPSVNLSFEKMLIGYFIVCEGTTVLKLGSCSLHPVHNAFRKGVGCLSFDVDQFFQDIHFFLISCLASTEKTMIVSKR